MKKSITIFFICLFSVGITAQQYLPKSYDKEVKTIMLFNPETNDETPIIPIGKHFVFSFDVLNKGFERLYYTIKHYDRNWNPSNLFESEYINGYNTSQINDYKLSFNTIQQYTHYTLLFPNNDMQPKISGNYVLTVYRDSPDKPLLTQRFSIYEPIMTVGVKYERINQKQTELNQKVAVDASYSDPSLVVKNVSLCILQNNVWENALCNIPPQFITSNSLTFGQMTNVFDGGNEYYSFDTKNINISGQTTEKIEKDEKQVSHVFLYLNQAYPEDYVNNYDVNGAFYIRRFDLSVEREGSNEADYVWVNFGLSLYNPLPDKDIYVVGSFNNYELSEDNKLIFNEQGRFYEKSLFLKQGYYNYTYATVDNKTEQVSLGELPGSFWETENLYQALIYYSPFGGTYDALIGYGEYRMMR